MASKLLQHLPSIVTHGMGDVPEGRVGSYLLLYRQ